MWYSSRVHGLGHSERTGQMSVKATTRRAKPVWEIQVIREGGEFNRRRYLDRRSCRKAAALAIEAELIAEYEAMKGPQPGAAGAATAEMIEARSSVEVDRAPEQIARERAPSRIAAQVPRRRRVVVTAASPTTTPALVPTFAEFAERYLALQDPTRSDLRNKVRNLRLHLLPELAHLRLDAITSMAIDRLRAKMRVPTDEVASSRRSAGRKEAPVCARRKGGRKSPRTINNVLTTLRSMLHLALDYQLIERVPRIRMEKAELPDPVFLEEEEIDRLVAAVPVEWRLFVLTAVRTGLRRGELMGLRWDDLRLEVERPSLRVQRSVRQEERGKLGEKPPKGGKPRSVPLTRDLAAALHTARPTTVHRTSLVFPGPLQGYLDHQRIWKMLVQAGKDAGLDKHVHPHLLRHTFASLCYKRGIPPQVVQLWLGHAHITTTERYAHLAPNAGEDLIDLLVSPAGTTTPAAPCAIRGNTTGNTKGGQQT
jgi:integrase